MSVIPVDFRPHVVIFTKDGRTYDLGPDAVGEPLGDVLGEGCPERMRHWKRYRIEGGKSLIVRPEDQPAEIATVTPLYSPPGGL